MERENHTAAGQPQRFLPTDTQRRLESQKRMFARHLLTTNDPILAGKRTFPKENGKAIQAAEGWISDPIVEHECERLKRVDDDVSATKLPSKDEYAKFLWKNAKSAKTSDEKWKFAKLFAETKGFLEKPIDSTAEKQEIPVNKVMVVPSADSRKEWEDQISDQQDNLRKRAESMASDLGIEMDV